MTSHDLKIVVGWSAFYGTVVGIGVVCGITFMVEWLMGRRRGNNAR